MEDLSYDDLFSIFTFMKLEDLCTACRVCKDWYNHIEEDSERVLWINHTTKNAWLQNLSQEKQFQTGLRKETSGWKRFLSIFADNYGCWETTPSWSDEQLIVVENRGTSVRAIGSGHMNVSACGSYNIGKSTVKYFELVITQKMHGWNIGVGLAQKSFLLLRRKFCGFNIQNWGYSSNGFCREFSKKKASQFTQIPNFDLFDTGDRIGMLVDMKSHQYTIFKNKKHIYTFHSLFIADNTPLNVVCTLHSTDDQIDLEYNHVDLEWEQALQMYSGLEETLKASWVHFEQKKLELRELANSILQTTDDMLIEDAIAALTDVIQKGQI